MPVGRADLGALGVANGHPHGVGAGGLDVEADDPGGAVDVGRDREVGHSHDRRAVEPHRAGEARVVVEVVQVLLLAAAIVGDGDAARRDRDVGELVADAHREAELLARGHQLGDVGLERRVAADVLGHLGVVHVDDAFVGRRVESHEDAFAGPAARHADGALVPDPADVVADRRVGEEVVVARGHGGLEGRVERGPPQRVGGAGVDRELPESVEVDELTGRAGLGLQHEGLSVAPLRNVASLRLHCRSTDAPGTGYDTSEPCFGNFGNRLPKLRSER